MKIKRLDRTDIKELIKLSSSEGFPYQLTLELAAIFCNGIIPDKPTQQSYGIFIDNRLVSVMTATFLYEFPHEDRPSGKVVQVSGAYTIPEHRHKRLATYLLKLIENDAKIHYKADYICCDSSADDLYKNANWNYSNESRMWKML